MESLFLVKAHSADDPRIDEGILTAKQVKTGYPIVSAIIDDVRGEFMHLQLTIGLWHLDIRTVET